MKKTLYVIAGLVLLGMVFSYFYFWNNKSDVSVSDPALQKIKQSGVLTVGVDFSYGVMEFSDKDNQPVGIDIDIINEVAKRLGVKAEIKQYAWEELFMAVKSGEIDLAISSITITSERLEEMLFSAPYFNGGQSIIVRNDNTEILGVSDLKNKKIGVQKETTSYDEAIKLTDSESVVLYESWEDAILAGGIISDLKEGKTDAVIVDYIQAVDSVKGDSELKLVGEPFTQEYYGIASQKENAVLVEAVNTILRDMKREGLLETIKSKWTK